MSNSKPSPFNLAASFNTRDDSDTDPVTEKQTDRLNIAILGNFSHSTGKPDHIDLDQRSFIEVDRFNFDEVFASMALQLSVTLEDNEESKVNASFDSIKDFHPDSLYKKLSVFNQLRDLRDRLNNPETFKQALSELGLPVEIVGTSKSETETVTDPQPPSADISNPKVDSGASLLDSILDETEMRSGQNEQPDNNREKSLINAFVKQVLTGRKVTSRDARQNEMVASIDEAITEQMRRLLHHPEFQALESIWRSVQFLVKRIRNGKGIKFYLLDVTYDELVADLAQDDLTQSRLYSHFCDQALGEIQWDLILGNFHFGPDIDDILTLSQIGSIAKTCGAQFHSAANEQLIGCPSFTEAPNVNQWNVELHSSIEEGWQMIRKSPVAKSISLSLPQFLLRTPYGSQSIPVKTFSFEEMPLLPPHNDYLWGNSAFIKVEQIARAFLKKSSKLPLGEVMKTDDLPIHYYQSGGQTRVKPCAEIALTDTGAAKMLAQGLIPLWSVKNADKIHSGDFHSIVADPD
ncbi:MAG: type VI secretion system protein ImpC [Gammaproteobacteria bacterium]|jgi:type VI secretion system protein ImpC